MAVINTYPIYEEEILHKQIPREITKQIQEELVEHPLWPEIPITKLEEELKEIEPRWKKPLDP